MSGTLYKGAKITFVTEQVEQKTLYKPRVENYSALIAQDINANWGRTTSAEIKEDAINRNDAHAKSAVFYFHKHSYQLWGSQGAGPLDRASRAIGSSGTFFASFLGVQKGRTNGRSSL